MIAIIGAGPAGLYTAIKFWQAGVRDICVFDPRAGFYTRPGNLNKKVIDKIETNLCLSFHRSSIEHIKDAERGLYAEAKALGINIHQKAFVSLHNEIGNPGIMVRNPDGSDEFIKANYVFDCTGSKRIVVHQANLLLAEPPFRIVKIADNPCPHHFLAYIKLSEEDISRINGDRPPATPFPYDIPPLAFAKAMIKLREFGWYNLLPPRCFAVSFGKGKACVYLHIPANLPLARRNEWLQAVLNCYAPSVHFEHLPPSKKYHSKPRLMEFTVSLNEIKDLAHIDPGLPTIIPLGDAQIDAEYTIGHGVTDGIDRIDALFASLLIREGQLIDFNAALYETKLKEPLRVHRIAIQTEIKRQQSFMRDGPIFIKTQLTNALEKTEDEEEIIQFSNILNEIEIRDQFLKSYIKLQIDFGFISNIKYKLTRVDDQVMALQAIQSILFKTITQLPPFYVVEHQQACGLLCGLSNEWMNLGLFAAEHKKEALAINAYGHALDIYDLKLSEESHTIKEIKALTALGQLYYNQGHYPKAIDVSRTAVILSHTSNYPQQLQQKSILLLLSALYQEGTIARAMKDHEEAVKLFKEAQGVVKKYGSSLPTITAEDILHKMTKLVVIVEAPTFAGSGFGTFFKSTPPRVLDDCLWNKKTLEK